MQDDQINLWLQKASESFNARDYKNSIQWCQKAFDAFPEFQSSQTTQFINSFPATNRNQYWNAPAGYFPNTADLKSTFETIYDRSMWGGGSGAGSDLPNNILYVAYVQHLIGRFSVRSIIDLGCGDWRFSRFIDFAKCQYHGVDIVTSVILENQKRYTKNNISFAVEDITEFDFPACDLLLCKDVLQHLSNKNVSTILHRIKTARVALLTNDYHPANNDVENGSTRPLDISQPPFNFPATPRLFFHGKVSFLYLNKIR